MLDAQASIPSRITPMHTMARAIGTRAATTIGKDMAEPGFWVRVSEFAEGIRESELANSVTRLPNPAEHCRHHAAAIASAIPATSQNESRQPAKRTHPATNANTAITATFAAAFTAKTAPL